MSGVVQKSMAGSHEHNSLSKEDGLEHNSTPSAPAQPVTLLMTPNCFFHSLFLPQQDLQPLLLGDFDDLHSLTRSAKPFFIVKEKRVCGDLNPRCFFFVTLELFLSVTMLQCLKSWNGQLGDGTSVINRL